MGVLHLWEILSSTGDKGKRIMELSGKVVAVDLSMWILEFRKCEGTQHLYNLYLRNLFYRTLDFMKDGVQLIFVLDGLAPEIKHDKLKKQRENINFEIDLDPDTSVRPYLERYSMECVKLIECLGLPWINSPGEAEEMCAYLEKKGIVDGCITKDSDFFCYGGKTIYRNLRRECKVYVFDLFKMIDIESKLGYQRSDLVAMALLLGCDYNQGGVKNVGKDKAVTLTKIWKEKGIDPLKRILGWQENKELDEAELKSKSRSHKYPHCKKCGHKGNTQSHQKAGCAVCKTEADCNGSCDILCNCDWHREDQLIQKHKLEVTVRQRSRETTDFLQKSNKVVEEFMKPDLGIDLSKDDLVWRPVDMKALVDYLNCKLFMPQTKVIEVITPVFIVSQLYQDGDDLMFTPTRIERQCKHCGVLGYLVSWDKTDRNTWPMASCVEVKVEKKLFARRFPDLVTEFEKRKDTKAPAVKRKENMTSGKDDTTPLKKTVSSKDPQNKSRSFVEDKQNLQKQKFPSITQFFTPQPSSDQKSASKQTPSTVSQAIFGQTSVSQSSTEGSAQGQVSIKKQAVDQASVSQTTASQPAVRQQSVCQPSVCRPSLSQPSLSQPSVSYQNVGTKRQLNFSKASLATPKKLHLDHDGKLLSGIKTGRQNTPVKQGVQSKGILKGQVKKKVKGVWHTTFYGTKGSGLKIFNSTEPVIDLTEDETDEVQENHASSYTTSVRGSMKYPDLTGEDKMAASSDGVIKSIHGSGSIRYPNLIVENRGRVASRGVASVVNVVKDSSKVGQTFGVSESGLLKLQEQSELEKLDLRLGNKNDFELVEVSEEELNLSLT